MKKIRIIYLLAFCFIFSFQINEALASRVSVMLDNYKDAWPLSGVSESDLVFEFPVEGGITRLMTVYQDHSSVASSTSLGPVRSARPYFASVSDSFNTVYLHAGGSELALSGLLDGTYDVFDMDYLRNAYDYFYRTSEDGRIAPHNLYTTFGSISDFLTDNNFSQAETAWPLSYSNTVPEEGAFPQNEILVDYDGDDYDLRWVYNSETDKYLRYVKTATGYEAYVDDSEEIVSTNNVVIQYAQTDSLKDLLENEGRALMCRNGKCENGNWRKNESDEVVKYYDFSGNEFVFAPGKAWINVTPNRYFHDIELETGWNVVSTPRVLENHQFSVDESLSNFDILSLDPNNAFGWASMADLGQTEFTPLYGYFIKNKTGEKQTLTLNYARDLEPNQALFTRELSAGWNVLGVANPSYALKQSVLDDINTGNIDEILASISSGVGSVLDFNSGSAKRKDVYLTDTWDSRTFSQVNLMNDFLETKAYGVYMNQTAVYSGYQNQDPVFGNEEVEPSEFSNIEVSFDGPLASDIKDNTKDIVFANLKIKAVGENVEVEKLTVTLTMKTGSIVSNPVNIEMVDETNNVSYSVSDPTANLSTHSLVFENIFLAKDVQYNFEIRGDIPEGSISGQTYDVSIDFNSGFNAYLRDFNKTAVEVTDLSASNLSGKVMTVVYPAVTFSKVTTSNATYVENTDKVFLFKGKITANTVSDLKVSKISFTGTFGSGATYFGDSFDKLYLYLASDDMGTPLDDESLLSSATGVSFSGFNLTVPAGTSNGVYVVVRGDIKDNPVAGTYLLKWNQTLDSNYSVKDEDNDAVTSATISADSGHISSIAGPGAFTMEFNKTISGLNMDKNILAGTEALVGRIKMTAVNEAVVLEDFTLDNIYGTATANDVASLKLYNDAEMTDYIGEATLDSAKRAFFNDINITIPTSVSRYVYVAANLKSIDYSMVPSANATATAGRTIILDIASSSLGSIYDVKAVGVSTGDELSNTGVASTTQTFTSTILGAIVSNVTSAFPNGLLHNGVTDLYSFKVTAPQSDNIDYDMESLGVKIATTTFTIATSSGVNLSSFKIERIGGVDGELNTKLDGGANTSVGAGNFVINFSETFGSSEDLIIRPGETAEYVIRALVSGVDSNDSLQVSIEDLRNNLNYTHNTGDNGIDGDDISAVYTLLPGVTYVRGGTLTN